MVGFLIAGHIYFKERNTNAITECIHTHTQKEVIFMVVLPPCLELRMKVTVIVNLKKFESVFCLHTNTLIIIQITLVNLTS